MERAKWLVAAAMVLALLLLLLLYFTQNPTGRATRKSLLLSEQLSDPGALIASSYSVKQLSHKKSPFLDSSEVPLVGIIGVGTAKVVNKRNFPILKNLTAYTVEIWEEHLRTPHWHNAFEIGWLQEGLLQVFIAAPFQSRLTSKEGKITESPDPVSHGGNHHPCWTSLVHSRRPNPFPSQHWHRTSHHDRWL